MAGGKENIQILLRGITAFQALYRGHRIRKAMKKVREEFSSIFADIEGEDSFLFDVQWHPHFIVGRPFIKRNEQSDYFTAPGENCNHNVEESTKDFSDSSSKPISNERDVEIGLLDKEQSESQPSAFSNGIEQTEESEKNLQPPLPNGKGTLNEYSTESGESLSNSTLQSSQIRKQDSTEEALGCEKSTELSNGDQNVLHLLELGNLKSMTEKALSQKEKEIQMELIWIQQAIDSRKQYIKLKG